ncbi:translation initiation factor 2 [Cryptosporangium minutisporangium]|uniref:translation initiation factor 2 n=1 Tax=Cryptosporangium minutisporangium TaxID=113569 RepID=UPI0031E946ED
MNGWAAPDGSADDTAWRRPTDSTTAVESRSGKPGGATAIPPQYQGPPRMHRPSVAVGWGPVITSGPTPRALPYQDHEALDREDAQARAVTVGVGVLTLVVLFLLLLMMVIRAGTTTGVA